MMKNRFGIPAFVTPYNGDDSHLLFRDDVYNPVTGFSGISKIVFDNKTYLMWRDNTGALRQCMALEGNNILVIKNFAGAGDIYINPQVAGGTVLFYDDGAGQRIAGWTKDWAWPVPCLPADPSTEGWGPFDFGKMWFNTTEKVFKYFDGEIRTLTEYTKLTSSPTSNYASSGIIIEDTVGEDVAAGDLLYVGSDGKWYKAKANSESTMPCAGLATQVKSANEVCRILLFGFYRNDSWSYTPGGLLYVYDTGGWPSQTPPSTTGYQVQVVGVAVASNIILFNPSYVLAEVS